MYQRLQQCASVPDFNNYLAFILTRGEGAPEEVRQTAGLLLKNNLKSGWGAATRENKVFIQNALLQSLGHPVRFLRHTVGMRVHDARRGAQAGRRCTSRPDAIAGDGVRGPEPHGRRTGRGI